MARFERKQIPFLHNGMNWNNPIEKLQDGEWSWCKNVRVLERGTISDAHGHTQVFTFPTATQYIHSISRLNILNEAINANGSTAFDPNLRRTYVVGADQQLYGFQDQTSLSNAALNPVLTPNNRGQSGSLIPNFEPFSGNPLAVLDAQPAGAAVAWKYIADSKQMVTVGYYPGDTYNATMARCLTVGLDPPVNNTIPVVHPGTSTDPGHLLGKYQWIFAYRRVQTGARSNPSAATRADVANPATTLQDASGNSLPFYVTMQLPQVPIDPQTGQPDANVLVDVYRFGGVVLRWALVGSGPGGSTFTDNTEDLNLLAAPAPPQTTDASTGLTRFNLYRPFVTQDIARKGTARLSQQASNNAFILTADVPGSFNVHWVPGSTIYVNMVACTIYQVQSSNVIELADNLTGQLSGGDYAWSINAGTLMTAQPLPHIWGPYGIGQSGSYIFACGDPNAKGTLYWTNGNDPDSTDIVNNIIVTSPSERLMTGAVYDGQPYCWSTERQFQIFPSLTVFGQFTTQEIAGAKGVWLEWSLSVQSNGLTDQSVSWRGKDGIYDWGANGLQRLTDPLYAFFPHDGGPGLAPETILPGIGANSSLPEHVGNLDDSHPQYHRLCWFHGLLFYDFVALSERDGGVDMPTYSTLVWDTVNTGNNGGWVSLDQPFADQAHPVARGIEIGANLAITPQGTPDVDALPQGNPPIFGPAQRGGNLKVSWSNILYDYYGTARGFPSRVITRAEDMGDSRTQKRWGDYWLDCTPLDTFTVYPLAGFHRCIMQPVTVPGGQTAITPDFCPNPSEPGSRAQFILDFQEFLNQDGASLMSPTLGLDIRWSAIDSPFASTLSQWSPSYVSKPEIISFRASDPDDLGQLQAKYFTGFNMEANTFGQTLNMNVLIDNNLVATLPVNHNMQSEHPYAFTPQAGYETQVQMQSPQSVNGEPPTWQLYKLNWIFEPWPDSVARDSFFSDLGYTGSKFLQGMVVPMETGGQQVTFNVQGDCAQRAEMGPVSTPNLCKMDIAFSFSPCNTFPSDPFIASQVQIQPNQAARFWYDQIRWVWEPEPELVATWVTQPTDFDLPGWHSQRDCYIAYRGGNGAPILYVTTEYSTEQYQLDYVGPNQYTRCYRVLKPQKAKWRYFRVESCGLFRLYLKDCEVKVKAWGTTGPYISAQPFGDLSRTNGGARI